MKIPGFLKPSRKKLIILVLLIIAGVLGFVFLGQKKQAPLQFASVKRADIRSTVSSSGTLTGKNSANLKFKISGKLAYLKIKLGDTVAAGQLIAGLDTQDLSITLQQAQNTLRDKQATVDKIHDDIKDHDKDETFTQKQNRTTAEVARDNAYDGVKAAQRAFQDDVIVSPINGIITQAIQVSGQTVSVSDLIAQVVDTSTIFFDTDVDEADVSKIAAGLPTEVTLDAYGKENFKGLVDQILPQTKTTSSGATVVTVRIKLENFSKTFVNGLSGESQIITKTSSNVLAIPIEALRDDNTVVVQKGQKFEAGKVQTGIQSDTDIEIKSGLTEADKVLLNPPAPGSDLTKIK